MQSPTLDQRPQQGTKKWSSESTSARIQEPRGRRATQPTFWYSRQRFRPGPNPSTAGMHLNNSREKTTIVTTIFERLDRGRPAPKPERRQQTSPQLEILLDWLLNRWDKPTVSARDIYRSGPGPI